LTEIITIKCGMVNCWLVRGEGGSVLVDTAVVRYREMILDRVKNENVKLIIQTHGHVDHIGNTAFLAERLHVPVAMHPDDAELIGKPHARALNANTYLGRLLKIGTDKSMYKAPSFSPSVLLSGGEKLYDNYGVSAQVSALPGHTKGSIGLLVNGADFIVGDAMFNILKPTPGRLYEDHDSLLESVLRIKLSRCSVIHPGHGRCFPSSAYFETHPL